MKKILLSFILGFLAFTGFSQGEEVQRFTFDEKKKPSKAVANTPYLYLGPGSGLYTYTGILGGIVEVPVVPHLSVFVGFGLGGWGYKAGGGVLFYLHKDDYLGSAFGAGVSNAFGLDDFTTELTLAGTNGDATSVTLDLYNAPSLNLTYQYHFSLGSSGKFVVGTGYAIAMVDTPYKLVAPPNAELDATSKRIMQLLQPSGLIISVAFQFGIGKR